MLQPILAISLFLVSSGAAEIPAIPNGNAEFQRVPFVFSQNALEGEIRAWVERQSPDSGVLRAEQLFVPKVTRPPQGEVSVMVRPRGSRSLVGRVSLFVDIEQKGQIVRTLAVQVKTSLETLTGRLKRDLPRGTPISGDLIHWEIQRLERLSSPLVNPDQLHNLQVRQTLRSGTLLTHRQVETIPLVERNQRVMVSAVHAGLTVQMRALALQTGHEGDVIRLKNLDSNQIFSGLVSGPGEVRLAF